MTNVKSDEMVKSLKTVTPAEAGVQDSLNLLDSRFRENDKNWEIATSYEIIKVESLEFVRGNFKHFWLGFQG